MDLLFQVRNHIQHQAWVFFLALAVQATTWWISFPSCLVWLMLLPLREVAQCDASRHRLRVVDGRSLSQSAYGEAWRRDRYFRRQKVLRAWCWAVTMNLRQVVCVHGKSHGNFVYKQRCYGQGRLVTKDKDDIFFIYIMIYLFYLQMIQFQWLHLPYAQCASQHEVLHHTNRLG